MGQHKYNPTAIAAKNGQLTPKPQKMSKRERRILMEAMLNKSLRNCGIPAAEDLLKLSKVPKYY